MALVLWHRRIRRKVESLLPSLEVTSASTNSTCSLQSPGVRGSLSCLLQQAGSTLLALEGNFLPKCGTLYPHISPMLTEYHCWRTLLFGRVKAKCSFVLCPTPRGAFPWGKECFLLAEVSVQTLVCCGVPGREDLCQMCCYSMHSHF